MGHSFEFDVESVEEGTSAQLSDWSISPDPEPNVFGETECSETAVEEWDELPDESIKDRVALFLARLKAKSSNTFSGIRDVVEHTSSLIRDIVDGLKRRTVSFLREIGHSETPTAQELLEQFEAAEPFRGFESEYRQIKFFTQSGYFVQPEALPLPGFSYVQETDRETGTVKQVAVRDTFQYVPLKAMLKLVLESPGIMEKILEWRNHETTALEDLRDGTLFRTNHLFSEELSIPIAIYADDCEIVNPLGSKTSVHKLGLIYFTIKCLPPEYLSSLKSHFLLAVYKSNDVKHYGGMNVVLDPIVNEIRDMEQNGIQIEARHFKGTVKVGLAQVCGDNLGLNSILGYNESFSGNFSCRICRVRKEVLWEQTVEDPLLLRDKVNYQSDCLLNNPTETGVKRDCSLNKLQFYHVTDNVTTDVMHDILEGVGGLEIKLVLNSLIEQKVMTLEQVNNRLVSFDYGFYDVHNKPSEIKPQDLKYPDGAFRQTATQTWCLLRLLPLMIGDLVPEGNKHWELLLSLLSCMELIFSPELTQGAIISLKNLIHDHHCLYLELYPDRHLKPKHHFMVHYASTIRTLGPVVHFWSMRFEAKHSFFKQVSHVNCNFRNICKTQAYRHQIMMCYTLLSGQLFNHNFEVGPGHTDLLGTIDDFEKVKCGFDGIATFTEVYLASWIKYKGTSYRPGMTLGFLTLPMVSLSLEPFRALW